MIITKIHINLLIQDVAEREVLQIGAILEPDPIGFSFETMGWKVLLFALLLLALTLLKIQYNKYKIHAYRRIGVKKLKDIRLANHLDAKLKITSSMFVLKEIALNSYPRNEIASLTGINWLEFLSKSCKETDFIKFNKIIEDAIFKNKIETDASIEIEELISIGIKWIKNHA